MSKLDGFHFLDAITQALIERGREARRLENHFLYTDGAGIPCECPAHLAEDDDNWRAAFRGGGE